MSVLCTPRLELVPMTLPMVEAVMAGRREDAEAIAGALLPRAWPGPALIERAFSASLERIRESPARRLWGDRLMVVPGAPRLIIGSVVFHGKPDEAEGVAEMAYGVKEGSQGRGFATEATRAALEWALAQPGVRAVQATTAVWHKQSLRVIEKMEMRQVGTREHDLLGELLVFERARAIAAGPKTK